MRTGTANFPLHGGNAPAWLFGRMTKLPSRGKDGFPYPVDKKLYDRSISTIKKAVRKAKVGDMEKAEAIRRLGRFYEID